MPSSSSSGASRRGTRRKRHWLHRRRSSAARTPSERTASIGERAAPREGSSWKPGSMAVPVVVEQSFSTCASLSLSFSSHRQVRTELSASPGARFERPLQLTRAAEGKGRVRCAVAAETCSNQKVRRRIGKKEVQEKVVVRRFSPPLFLSHFLASTSSFFFFFSCLAKRKIVFPNETNNQNSL